MKRVITYGTFDLFHIGHLNLLERLAELGDHLTVAVSTDEFNLGKGKVCSMPYDERSRIVGALRCVDRVIQEESWDQKPRDVQELGIDVFGIGDDWQGKFDHLAQYCEVVYLTRTHGISTTSLKLDIAMNADARK
ncbi:adenylyltransferase/cytidyltransferase family protein [Nocardioides panacisoli]|uniref:adenylyltransferase/cytidyltransferase family protein n=1 Tax=Nocardioides panacisoli TaxID=627624 RepID=UPI001C62BFC4|nr:adenylyltransferase/cytidyltransferase family protein [Nocardioides panacisoli]QYJ03273.1 adenylyltransferase/cytidyltransferase family protein [Nocardioides panacisoli]